MGKTLRRRGRKLGLWFRDLPLTRKLNIAYGAILVIPILTLILIVNTLIAHAAIEREVRRSRQSISVITQGLDLLADHVVDLSKIAVSNMQVQEIVRDYEGMSGSHKFVAQRLLRSVLDSIIEPRTVVSSMVVYGTSGPIGASSAVRLDAVPQVPEYGRPTAEGAGAGLSTLVHRDVHSVAYHEVGEAVYAVSLFRPIVDVESGRTMGVLEVNVDERRIFRLFGSVLDGSRQEVLILNRKGTVIAHRDTALLGKDLSGADYFTAVGDPDRRSFVARDRDHVYTFLPFDRLGWYVVRGESLDAVLEDVRALTVSIYVIGIICIILGLFASAVFSGVISRPITDLSHLMESAGQGDLEVRSRHRSRDEVGILSLTFNRMIGRIEELLRDVSEAERRQREYELAALQEQINPHFLYNTLESVCALSRMDRGRDVYRMVKSLSRFYRIILSEGRNVITIGEELRLAEYYLIIQTIRYPDRLHFRFAVDDAIRDCGIIKLTLQPIVENAIYHGLKQQNRLGTVTVSGFLREGTAVLQVHDDGVGIPPDKLGRILEREGERLSGFGLWSVHERIRLHYGPAYGISVRSVLEEGTAVEITLPAEWIEKT